MLEVFGPRIIAVPVSLRMKDVHRLWQGSLEISDIEAIGQ